MPRQLTADCLNEVFKYLDDDATLHSCFLVNCHWCEVSVRILWRKIWNYNTLVACLPTQSKEILRDNDIPFSILTSKSPLFNYITFIKSFSIHELDKKIKKLLKTHQPNLSPDLFEEKYVIIMKHIFIMLMNQTSLKELNFYLSEYIPNITFFSYPGAMNCL